jgi:hypothetical protein
MGRRPRALVLRSSVARPEGVVEAVMLFFFFPVVWGAYLCPYDAVLAGVVFISGLKTVFSLKLADVRLCPSPTLPTERLDF